MVRRCGLVLNVILAGGICLGESLPGRIVQLRKKRQDDKGRDVYLYKFDKLADEYVSMAEQAPRRGAEAELAWKEFDKQLDELPVVARSPFGGGETAESYWPAGVRPELLRKALAPLKGRGFHIVFPELPDEQDQAKDKTSEKDAAKEPPEPWPKDGFSEDHPFVLVVGMHHEPIPYKSAHRTADGQVTLVRSSRVNAWAILFHAPTGSGFWATTAVGRVGHGAVEDPLNCAAEMALGYLDFSDLGKHNVPAHIARFAQREELPAIDVAALLMQTQRADAAAAVIKAAMSKGAFTNTAWVLRWFSQRGTPQDYRLDSGQLKKQRCVRVSQRLMLRILLMEQLRAMRGVQPCVLTSSLPYEEDIEVQPLGGVYGGRLGPLCADDEIVLIAELANGRLSDRRGPFYRNAAAAVRALGRCRVHVAEAMTVARVFAERKPPKPRRGKRPRRDALKEAGQAALTDLQRTRAEQAKKRRSP